MYTGTLLSPEILTPRQVGTQNDIFYFNRTGKTLVEGNRAEYRFNPNDAVTKQIIARAKALKEPPEPQKESNAEPQQNS